MDLSGYSSKCSAIGQRGTTKPHRFKYHPEFKDSIGGLIDYTTGQYKHVRAVNDYLIKALPTWIETEPFMTQVSTKLKVISIIWSINEFYSK